MVTEDDIHQCECCLFFYLPLTRGDKRGEKSFAEIIAYAESFPAGATPLCLPNLHTLRIISLITSRLTLRDCETALTAAQIRRGGLSKTLNEVMKSQTQRLI